MDHVFSGIAAFAASATGRDHGRSALRRAIGACSAGVLALAFLLPAQRVQAGQRVVRSLIEFRHENVVIQKWDLSCGAAALATLLRFQHGEQVTERDIALSLMKREEYIRNPKLVQAREGFSLLDLKRDVDARGYAGSGYGKLQLKDLIEKAPLIVPISVNGYKHFVVFRGIRNDRVILADPAWGNRSMPVPDFVASWIDYPVLGHIGFAVRRRDGMAPPNRLAPGRPASEPAR